VVALSLLLVVAAAVASLFLVQGVDQQMRDVLHTYEVRRQARELVQALTDAETGQRGYILTQDNAYLDPYRSAVTSLDATYRNLTEIVADNPAQQQTIGDLAEPIERKRAEMATTITLASNGRVTEALAIIRDGDGLALMEGIRASLGAFIAEEDSKLIERNERFDAARLWLVAMIIAALGGTAILTFALFTRTQAQMTNLNRSRNLLQSQNEELEARVQERTAEAEVAREHAERERARVEALLQDTNHRIGNSLATVSSLLGLQVARTRSEEVRQALEAAQNRVQSVASGHRRLRLGADLETTNAAEFLASVVEDLEMTHGEGRKVTFETLVEPLIIPARDATTIGILVGELVINAVKHAFPDNAPGHIWTRLSADGDGATLVVEDDGTGIAPEVLENETGLGSLIVRQLALQFNGEPQYARRDEGGTRIVVPLPGLKTATTAT
jgi:two-component sensor histidine kinase/CHASE3 domain sensor protein